MTKRISTGSFLPPGVESEASTKKAANGIVRDWPQFKPHQDPVGLIEEVSDGFAFMDMVGGRSPEAQGARFEENLAPAPCGRCKIETCPGSLGECLLNTNPILALIGIEDEEGDGEEKEINPMNNNREILEKPEPIQCARAAKAYVHSSGSGHQGAYMRLFTALPLAYFTKE